MKCKEKKKSETNKEDKLRNRIRDKEITITCKTSLDELKEKNLALSFILQGYSYS